MNQEENAGENTTASSVEAWLRTLKHKTLDNDFGQKVREAQTTVNVKNSLWVTTKRSSV